MTRASVSLIGFTWLVPCAWAQTEIGIEQIRDLLRSHEAALEVTLKRSIQNLQNTPGSKTDLQNAAQVLDLLGRPDQATAQYQRLLELSEKPEERIPVQRLMGISRGFAGDCKGAEAVEKDAVAKLISSGDFYDAGQVSDEIGRICLESGDFSAARKWYSNGNATGLREENLSNERYALWNFRWLHAQARLAARQGDFKLARKRSEEAISLVKKGLPADQTTYVPYLAGYVAFYAGDYTTARAQLEKAQIDDPFIQCLLGRTFEKLGLLDQALDRYRYVTNSTAHGVNLANAMYWLRSRAATPPMQ